MTNIPFSKFTSLVLLTGLAAACGVNESEPIAQPDLSDKSNAAKAGAKGEGEDSLGFKFSKGTGVGAQTHMTAYLSKKDPEHWEYTKEDGNPFLYEPTGVLKSLSAFRHAQFDGSNQTCSGILYNEPQSSGKFNIYYLTAKHCLYEVTPLGDRKNSAATVNLKSYKSSKILSSTGDTTAAFSRHFFPYSGKYMGRVKYFDSVNLIESFQTGNAEVYESSDIIRIPVKINNVSAEYSMPLCNSVEPAADKSFGQTQTGIRMILAHDSENKRLGLERLNGNHNLDGMKNGEFRSAASFSGIKNFIFSSLTFGNKVTYYGYKNAFSSGAEASDSGAPVLYGQQKPPSSLVSENLINSFWQGADKFAANWKVESLDCVSGVVSRIIARPNFAVYDSRRGWDWTWLVDEHVKVAGQETITVIQEVSASGTWNKIQ
ncbi:MAG: hypothetical protein EBR09_02405 [Proteobacteria bacterium]|nr:hypothetical protein [Pseudomonadota bacterium]